MLCDFALGFPAFVECVLDKDRTLRRSFREETVTDLLMGGLVMAGGRQLIVDFPDEPVTGADMEWNFVDVHTSTFFRLMLQAKRIYGNGSIWTRHCYRELLYKPGRPPEFQATTLCNAATASSVATYPFYIFYNSNYTCDLARKMGNKTISGVNIADGYAIENLVVSANTRALRTSNKSLKKVESKLYPLSALLCPPRIGRLPPFAFTSGTRPAGIYLSVGQKTAGVQMPPSPEDIRGRIIALRSGSVSEGVGPEQKFDSLAPAVPAVSRDIPADVQAVLSRRWDGGYRARGLDRWRLTFVTDSSKFEEG